MIDYMKTIVMLDSDIHSLEKRYNSLMNRKSEIIEMRYGLDLFRAYKK